MAPLSKLDLIKLGRRNLLTRVASLETNGAFSTAPYYDGHEGTPDDGNPPTTVIKYGYVHLKNRFNNASFEQYDRDNTNIPYGWDTNGTIGIIGPTYGVHGIHYVALTGVGASITQVVRTPKCSAVVSFYAKSPTAAGVNVALSASGNVSAFREMYRVDDSDVEIASSFVPGDGKWYRFYVSGILSDGTTTVTISNQSAGSLHIDAAKFEYIEGINEYIEPSDFSDQDGGLAGQLRNISAANIVTGTLIVGGSGVGPTPPFISVRNSSDVELVLINLNGVEVKGSGSVKVTGTGSILAGTVNAARTEMKATGFYAYSASNIEQFRVASSTGKMTIGNVGSTGARVEVDATGIKGFNPGNGTEIHLNAVTGKIHVGSDIVISSTDGFVAIETAGNPEAPTGAQKYVRLNSSGLHINMGALTIQDDRGLIILRGSGMTDVGIRPNRIKNPSFEVFDADETTPTHWTFSGTGVTHNQGNASDTDGICDVLLPANSSSPRILQQVVVPANTTVIVSAYVRANGATARVINDGLLTTGQATIVGATYGVNWRLDIEGNKFNQASESREIPNDGAWHRIYRAVHIPTAGTYMLRIYNWWAGGSLGAFEIDRIKVEFVGGNDVLANPSFYSDSDWSLAYKIRELSAANIIAGTLTVGGSTSTKPWISVLDGANTEIVRIGDTSGGYRGIWLKNAGTGLRASATATSVQRVELNSSGIRAFNSAGTTVTSIDSTSGALFAISANISGAITATSGSFTGGVTITGSGFLRVGTAGAQRMDITPSGLFAYNSTNVNKTSISASTGVLTATDVNITGAITATSGSFTGTVTVTGSGAFVAGGVTLNASGITLGNGDTSANQLKFGTQIWAHGVNGGAHAFNGNFTLISKGGGSTFSNAGQIVLQSVTATGIPAAFVQVGDASVADSTGQPVILAGNKIILQSNTLQREISGTVYTVSNYVHLQAWLDSSNWLGGNTKAITAGTTIPLNTEFGAPLGVKAVNIRGSATFATASDNNYLAFGPSATAAGVVCRSTNGGAGVALDFNGIVNCNASGNIVYIVNGQQATNVYLLITGYWV